jgi:hypothetical protein
LQALSAAQQGVRRTAESLLDLREFFLASSFICLSSESALFLKRTSSFIKRSANYQKQNNGATP